MQAGCNLFYRRQRICQWLAKNHVGGQRRTQCERTPIAYLRRQCRLLPLNPTPEPERDMVKAITLQGAAIGSTVSLALLHR
jgi:hypothetical protein